MIWRQMIPMSVNVVLVETQYDESDFIQVISIDERVDLVGQKIDKEVQTAPELQTIQITVERTSRSQQ